MERSAGRGWLTAACVLSLLFAAGHLAGFFHARWAARHDPALREVTALMREPRGDVMGFSPSLLDFREYFSVNFSILMTALALGVLVLGRGREPNAKRNVLAACAVLVGAMIALAATSAIYEIPQGLVSASAIGLLALIGLARAAIIVMPDR